MDKNMRFTMVNNPNYDGTDDGYVGPYYTLTVVGGSGSGSYKPGAQVVIVADDAKTGTVFSSWTRPMLRILALFCGIIVR